jgi:uncharacterized protein DUF998
VIEATSRNAATTQSATHSREAATTIALMPPRWIRLRSSCGLIGPAAFTAAWVLGARRQDEYSVADEHISGLAAADARDPYLMTTGFLALGACAVAFAAELDRRLGAGGRGAGPGPVLIGASGVATIAAGLLRRDRMSNTPPPGEPPGQSLRNDAHDLASIIAFAAGVLGTLASATRLREDPSLRDLATPAVATAVSSSGLMSYFATDVVRPGNGIVQRIGVSLPLVFMAAAAWRMLHR